MTKKSSDPVEVAFYGGSFTALSLENQKAFLGAVRPFIQNGQIRSIRLSTRPDCITIKLLELLKEHHVETIELGAQSMDDAILRNSGRGHTVSDTVSAVKMLRQASFSIGLQLMPGLPGDTKEIFRDTVEKTILLKPDFTRLYPVVVIKGTLLERLYRSGLYTPLSIDEAVAVCKHALVEFESKGIAVVRIGLQPTEELEKPGSVVAGPYHPAFRQLVESSILLDVMSSHLTGRKKLRGDVTFLVHPNELSTAIGQKQSNIESLKKQYGLKHILVQPDKSVPKRTPKLVMQPLPEQTTGVPI